MRLPLLTITILLFAFSIIVVAQTPTYEAKLMNDTLVAANQYEFEIFVKRTGSIVMEAYGLQVCLIFDDAIRNAGTLTSTYIAGSSTMNADQTPSNPNVASLVGTKRVWKLAGKIPTGGIGGSGTLISTVGNGTRLGRFRITTSAAAFSSVPANLAWNFNETTYGYATKFLVFSEDRLTLPDITSANQANHTSLLLNNPLSVSDEIVPIEFRVQQNYPNPFNPKTTIKFSVDRVERASVIVYNLLGQKVAELFDGIAQPGQYYKVELSAASLASGIYYYRVQTDTRSELKKMLLLK